MKRRVCHVLGSAQLEGSGIANIVMGLHRHLPSHRYELSACFVGQHGPLVEKFSAAGLATTVIPWKHPSRDVSGMLKLIGHLRSERYDIVHFHWGGLILRAITRTLTPGKIVLHLHSEIEEGKEVQGRIPTGGCDMVIAISQAVARVSDHANTKVVYSGVEEAVVVAESSAVSNVIGFAGRLTKIKGLQFLLQAAATLRAEFPGLKVRISGSGPMLVSLKDMTTSLGLDDAITFLGWVEDMTEERRQWTVLAQPSLVEGLGLSMLEGMSAGIPVVASRVGGIPEVIEDGVSGLLVEPADAKDLTGSLRRILTGESLHRQLAAGARKRVHEDFSAAKMSNKICDLYDELLT